MKAVITFNLDNPEDAERHRRMMKADDLCYVLWELAHCHDEDPDALCPDCKEKLFAYLHDNNIAFEEIWS